MPFHFKRKESVAKAVRRLCCERLDDALDILQKGARLQAAHDVRKEIKKLRSVLRLMRREIGKSAYGQNIRVLRNAANLLAAFRDAQVKLNAFDCLTRHFRRQLPARPFPEIRNVLQKNCRAEGKKLDKAMSSLRDILRESKKQVGRLEIDSKGWKAIAPGFKKIYCRGQDALEAVRHAPSPENFHEWRKRAKDLWHELRLLCPARPRNLRARTRNLEKLGDALGDDHDLFMLKEFVAGKFRRAPGVQTLEKLILSRQKKLRSAALKLGGRFYREKPGRFCRQVGNYWKEWRRE